MRISLNVILDQLNYLEPECHVPDPGSHLFSRTAVLPRDYHVIRTDLIHICTLSDALWVSKKCSDDVCFLCIRDRLKDEEETADALRGMVIINKNMDTQLLMASVQDIFVRVTEWYCSMHEVLLSSGSAQSFLDLSEELLGNSINITDSSFNLVAHTRKLEPKDIITKELIAHGHHPYSTIKMFREMDFFEQRYTNMDITITSAGATTSYPVVSKIYRHQGIYSFHIIMICDHRPLTEGLVELFKILTDIFSIYADKNWATQNTMFHAYDSFLSSLITGAKIEASELSSLATHYEIIPDDEMQLLKIGVPSGKEETLCVICTILQAVFPRCEILIRDDSAIILIHLQHTEADEAAFNEVIKTLDEWSARGGISAPFFGLKNLHAAYEQASIALRFNQLPYTTLSDPHLSFIARPSSICNYQNRILHGMLGQNRESLVLWHDSIYYQALKQLYEYDVENGTANLQLLYSYLHHERKSTDTGADLNIHRNNVSYRISRIEEFINLNLDDYSVRLGLAISFLMLEIFGI